MKKISAEASLFNRFAPLWNEVENFFELMRVTKFGPMHDEPE